ncbi:HPr-rel-A system PqqD family peptide chaperone [Sphingomonas oligophenolica]|uniref:HPr-rel-A system PqqD family peptide chaperone n=1 Tax=Sphingomonas oligophenolica TaxID=301154 RepID=A0A502CHA6_9SPHN|nr:HPr-rel-A system PqqD family peptide chaperone [Sphingomonas oligophenolica]TPG12092.1 HPr-rel-A system PqqD family peptide chaperone [Sphingomonas oligophenolica]
MRYRAPGADALIATDLDHFTALFHRTSGITHLLASPAPEILATLTTPMTLDELMAALVRDYALADPDRAALSARLDELIASGLVSPA